MERTQKRRVISLKRLFLILTLICLALVILRRPIRELQLNIDFSDTTTLWLGFQQPFRLIGWFFYLRFAEIQTSDPITRNATFNFGVITGGILMLLVTVTTLTSFLVYLDRLWNLTEIKNEESQTGQDG